MKSQNARLLSALKAGAHVTPAYALHMLSIGRLSARILELKQAGEDIRDEWVEVRNAFGERCRVKSYRLAKSAA